MPKLFDPLLEQMGFYNFPKDIILNVNEKVQLAFELFKYNLTVQNFSNYTAVTLLISYL